MRLRAYFSAFLIALTAVMPSTASYELPAGYFFLGEEPLIRIGLMTNAASVTVTTADSQLVAYSPEESARSLATNKVAVSARAYQPPVVEQFILEIQNLPGASEARTLADQIRETTGETALTSLDPKSNTWKVWIGEARDSREEIDALKTAMAEKGYDDAVVVAEKKTVHSEDAIALAQQLKSAGKSEVRSLVRAISSSGPAPSGDVVIPGLREVIVNGSSEVARYSSLKPVSFGSFDERANPVRLNGKAYRGKIEVFVNSRGSLTVVNVVPLEEYLLGVVPAELSLPSLEAQKAQAIAARTYAVANISGFARQGFDMRPDVWSQVYKGVSIETAMGTRAVHETAGMIATYNGKPITAYFTSTCGGRTENSENVFDKAEPYLRGVECSLEGRRHFEPFMIKTSRKPAKLRSEADLELVQVMSLLSVNGFAVNTDPITDDWLEDVPTPAEISNWSNNLAGKFGRTFPNVSKDTAKPLEFAKLISSFAYKPGEPDTLLSDSDVNYHLAFDDASAVPAGQRAELAALIRDGYFRLRPDMTLLPGKPYSRAEMIRLIRQIYEKRKWMPSLQSGTARPATDGKLVLRVGRTDRPITVRPDVYLYREFGGVMYPVKEVAIVGGEEIRYQTDSAGAVVYLEISPSTSPTVAENMSPFTNWTETVSAASVQSRLSRYVKGIGTLYDVNIRSRGYSRRATELEIIGSNGVKTLKGGKIRSALRLREQLFVINKKYSGNQVASYTFTGRGWGHGVGMCQYGAFGLAKMGVKFDDIIRHYYTGVQVTKAY